jgi:hypothetical protein
VAVGICAAMGPAADRWATRWVTASVSVVHAGASRHRSRGDASSVGSTKHHSRNLAGAIAFTFAEELMSPLGA